MEDINFALIADQLMAILGPIVGTIVSTIMGTEIFKRIFPNVSSRIVTTAVWAVIGLVVWLILQWFPLWFIIVLGVLAAGGYSWWLKPVIDKLGIASKDGKVPPIGGGGGGPKTRP